MSEFCYKIVASDRVKYVCVEAEPKSWQTRAPGSSAAKVKLSESRKRTFPRA